MSTFERTEVKSKASRPIDPHEIVNDPRIPDEEISKSDAQELWDLYKKIDLYKMLKGNAMFA